MTENLSGIKNMSDNINFTLPYVQKYLVSTLAQILKCSPPQCIYKYYYKGVDLTFPIDNTLQNCYAMRQSCVDNQWNEEVNHIYLVYSVYFYD